MPRPTLYEKGNLIQPDLPDVVPIEYIRETARKMMLEAPNTLNPFINRVLIIEAKTASGKSTSIPPWMHILSEELAQYARKKVVCTQPRTLTTQSIAESIDGAPYFKELNWTFTMGENLTFQTGNLQSKWIRSGLTFVTIGILTNQLKGNDASKIIKDYSVIIIDEAHERSSIFDTTMVQLRRFYEQNRDNKQLPLLILMSATFDYEKYRKYFGVEQTNVIRVKGFTYNIDERWPTDDYPLVHKAAAEKIYECVNEEVQLEVANYKKEGKTSSVKINSPNNILIFVPGNAESKGVSRMMDKIGKKRYTTTIDGISVAVDIEYVFVDSDSVKGVTKDYLKVMGMAEKSTSAQQIEFHIMAVGVTAVAETGLTIENLKYVIDCGWVRSGEFNPTYNITSMILAKPAAKSNIMQRRGRCGRVKDGVFIPLYTKKTFDALLDIQNPDIIFSDPTEIILGIIVSTGNFTQDSIPYFMDKPPQESIEFAIHKLQLLGFVTEDLTATHNGKLANILCSTISFEAIAMILAGFTYEVSIDDLVVIATMAPNLSGPKNIFGLSDAKIAKERSKNPGYQPPKTQVKDYEDIFSSVLNGHQIPNVYYKLRALFADDFITSIVIFRAFINHFENVKLKTKGKVELYTKLRDWGDVHRLKFDNILDAYNDYIAVKSELVNAGINVLYGAENTIANMLSDQETIDFLYGNKKLSKAIVDPIIKIKLCIYAGYKFNMAVLNPKTMTYHINYGGQEVSYLNYFSNDPDSKTNWDQFEIANNYQPDRLVFRQSVVKYKKVARYYVLELEGVCILSGFL